MQRIGIRHDNKYLSDSFKRRVGSFYKSYSKISEELLIEN